MKKKQWKEKIRKIRKQLSRWYLSLFLSILNVNNH